MQSWTISSGSFANYTYSGYTGSNNIKVAFTNDGGNLDLIVDLIEVCGNKLKAKQQDQDRVMTLGYTQMAT